MKKKDEEKQTYWAALKRLKLNSSDIDTSSLTVISNDSQENPDMILESKIAGENQILGLEIFGVSFQTTHIKGKYENQTEKIKSLSSNIFSSFTSDKSKERI